MSQHRVALHKPVSTIFKGAGTPDKVAPDGADRSASATCRKAQVKTIALMPKDAPVQGRVQVHPLKDEQIEILMSRVDCPKNYACYRSGLQNLCKASSLLGGRLVRCKERDQPCSRRLTFFCRCAIRQYIATAFGR